ncbi:hypothetical protein BJV82DRAFT_206515 [Fennellomyces sp. T-0311]|nr:hypothetical protein BJV82DRAFT_206515 [Fennellomyces sp. T-0311]
MYRNNAMSSPDDRPRLAAGGKMPRRSVLRRPNAPLRNCHRVSFHIKLNDELAKAPRRHYWRDIEIKTILECLQDHCPGAWNERTKTEKDKISHVVASDLFGHGYRVHPQTVGNKIEVLWRRYSQCYENGIQEEYKFYNKCHNAFSQDRPAQTTDG